MSLILFRSCYVLVLSLLAVACATSSSPPVDRQQRIERAESEVENDPIVQAHLAAVEAAQAKEERPKLVDGVELRVADGYMDNDHRIRALARVEVLNPLE